jgi:uncharacterized protein with von Willebrand factor type A (vWA) domain
LPPPHAFPETEAPTARSGQRLSGIFPARALPDAAAPFVAFATLLRANGFAVAPEQTTAFLSAITLLGPRSLDHIRRAAHATLAPPPERREEFDALFDAHFLGAVELGRETAEPDPDDMRVQEDRPGGFEPPASDAINEAGQAATAAEALSARRFGPADETDTLRHFQRALPERLPQRRGYRRVTARRGLGLDLRRAMKEAIRNDGEIFRLPRLRRRLRRRPILLLIDVSGSMKARTDAHLRFAHALVRAADRIEVFTIGTRLTRVTRALRLRNREQALSVASGLVSDWDGGTRIGDALQAFLAVPRFAGAARGAVVLVLSDGLERGDPKAMTDAVKRLAARAWHLSWMTPLAADPGYRPETAALKSILPHLDTLADAGSTERLCHHVLTLAQPRAA